MTSLLITLCILLIPAATYALEQSIKVEAIGEANLGDIDTPKEVKERAVRNAKNAAVEKAVGTFIKSHTLVSNNQIAEDLTYASVRGRIERVDILQEGWDEKDRRLYRVKLIALVKPVYPEKGEGMSLKMSLSESELKEGEEVRIFYESNTDAYIYIFVVAADGSVTLLLPNAISKDNFVAGKKAYEFPPADSRLHLSAVFLPDCMDKDAEERVKIIATKKREDLIPLGFREGMFKVYDAKSTGMINELVKKLNQLEPNEWTEYSAVYKIIR